MVLSSCCTSNQIPLSSYRLVSQPNYHVCISSAPCRWNLSALTSPTYSKTEIVKIKLLRLTIAGRMFDRFKSILFLSYHRLSRLSPKNASRLQTCVLIRNYFFLFLFCVVFFAILKHPTLSPLVTQAGSFSEAFLGCRLRCLCLILDTTILTDFRLHACTVTIIYYQF